MSDPRNQFEEESAAFDAEAEVAAEAEFDAATERGLADIEAGRVISHEAVKRWLMSWGTDNPLPPPKCGE